MRSHIIKAIEEATLDAITEEVGNWLAASSLGDGENPRALLPVLSDLAALIQRDDDSAVLLVYDGKTLGLHSAPSIGDPKLVDVERRAQEAGLDVLPVAPSDVRARIADGHRNA